MYEIDDTKRVVLLPIAESLEKFTKIRQMFSQTITNLLAFEFKIK